MRLLMTLLMACSTVACAAAPVERPNSDVCLINAEAGHRKCYNMARDYDANGRLKPGVKATYKNNLTITDLNKAVVIDSPTGFEDGWARLKTYINQLRESGRRGD